MKIIVIGVMPQEQIRARGIAIAKGQYKPRPGEPKIWFASMKSVAEVPSDQNRALLKVIREINPESLAVLARATGRQPGNLSRTLKTMSRYGLVDLQRKTEPRQAGREGERVSDRGSRLRSRARLLRATVSAARRGDGPHADVGCEG